MKRSITLLASLLLIGVQLHSQGVIISQSTTTTPEPSTMLEVEGTDGGMLLPELTEAQRLALTGSAAEGLWVYQTDKHPGMFVFQGSAWVRGSSSNSISGKVIVNGVTEALTGTFGSGFNVVQNPSDLGEFQVAFDSPFQELPTVMLSSETLEPIPTITSPSVYCFPAHTADCDIAFNADYLDDVRLQSCPDNGVGGVACDYGPNGFQDNGTDCDNPSGDNYVDKFNVASFQSTIYGPNYLDGNSFFNIYMRSSWEWRDNLFGFIDWNQDGDFEEGDEVVFEFYFPSSVPLTQAAPNGGNNTLDELIGDGTGYDSGTNPNPIEVPATAANGVTVFRAMSKWATSVPDPCGTHTFGETHDYKITVVGGDPSASTDFRGSNCSISNVQTTGFGVFCTDFNEKRKGTSFHFYATDN